MKPQDMKAAEITFGVELETTIPAAAGVVVVPYHGGPPVTSTESNIQPPRQIPWTTTQTS